jgi:hypothetical protein
MLFNGMNVRAVDKDLSGKLLYVGTCLSPACQRVTKFKISPSLP